MKIGILTFHRCINYGSFWQARCLAEGLQARGHNATILDHGSVRVNLAEWKCAYQPVLPTPVPETDQPLYRNKIRRFFRAFRSLPLSKSFRIENPAEMEAYDMVVVGSDEVWNLSHPWYGQYPIFYGDGLKAKRLVSYAASFGNYSAWNGLHSYWAEKLQNFRKISVRDENSKALVRNSLGIEPELVLDPCLQFKVEPEKRNYDAAEPTYIAVYGHNFSERFKREVKKFAKQRNLPLISIGYRNDWADRQWISADPHDFAHFIAGAAAVATNFFHGCVFALRNEKPFVCETTDYRSMKIQDLMREVGGEKHILNQETPAEMYHTLLNEPLAPEILQNIEQLRYNSNAYLDQALS